MARGGAERQGELEFALALRLRGAAQRQSRRIAGRRPPRESGVYRMQVWFISRYALKGGRLAV